MLAVVWSAIRIRRGPAVVMAVLVALTAGGLAAAGWFAERDAARVTAALIAAAPPAQRTIVVRGTIALGADPQEALRRFRATTESTAGLALEDGVAGVQLPGFVATATGERFATELRYRDDGCAGLTLTGRCPAGAGEVALPAALAERLGTTVQHSNGLGRQPLTLTVVGTFEQPGDYAITTLDTIAAAGVPAYATEDLLLPAAQFGRGDPAPVAAAVARLQRSSLEVSQNAEALNRSVAGERYAVTHGIVVAAVQLVAIGWIAIGVTAWYAAEGRRSDAARIALRGARRWRVLAATSGQSALPALIGAAVAGRTGLVVGAGALVLIVAADWRLTRAPVQRLLQSAPPRRAALAGAVLDLTVLALAVAAGYQSAVTGEAPVDGFGLELLTPVLLATAGAVLLTRLLLPPAVAAGRAALARGRVTAGLTALFLARRTSAYRIVPVLAAAACVCGVAAQDWARADTARLHRAQAEIGADRVLEIAPVPPERLLAAVRAADPQGRHAMAVVVAHASGPGPRILAVDSARLRAVAAVDPGPAIERLHPPAPGPIAFTGTTLTLRAAGGGTVAVGVTLAVHGTGETVRADFGAIGDDGPYDSDVMACKDGCRVVALDLRGDPGAQLELSELRADGKVVVDGAAFADPARWRTTVGGAATGLQRLRGDGRMRLATIAPARATEVDQHLYVVDAPLPLPVLGTPGSLREPDQSGTAELTLAGVALPVRPSTVDGMPGVILTDLEYADRLTTGLTRAKGARADERDQVWLAADAPPDIVGRLTAAGLRITGGDSVAAGRDRLARLGPAGALRFHLLAAAVGLLLAGAALTVVAAVQRRQRRAEFEALRRQGVPARVLRAAGRWSALAPVALALAIGLVAAAAARWLLRSPVRPFTDGWPVHEPAVSVPALLAALAAATICFTAAALGSGARR
nr:hypothetical protein GCM10020063_038970 [Dactylosporangium thailandense]